MERGVAVSARRRGADETYSVFSDRKADAHGGAGRSGGNERDVAVVAFENALGDGQPESGAAGPAGEKGIENARSEVGGNARAAVDDVDGGERRAAANVLADDDGERAAARHRFGGIEDEIEQDLLELALVGVDHQGGHGRIVAELNLGLRELWADEDESVGDDVGERPARVQGGGGFREVEHAQDDGLELVEFFVDDALVGVPRIVLREIEAEAAVQELDDGKRVSDFVRDLGGEEAEGGELLVLAQRL